MKLLLICVGTRMPEWVNTGIVDYQKRFPSQFRLEIKECPVAKRTKTTALSQCLTLEAASILQAIPSHFILIVLDVQGQLQSSEQLAQRLASYDSLGQNVALVIGGPDGIDESVMNKAKERWSFSPMTFPHPLIRLMCVEQLYRAWTILSNHPYHK